MSVGHLCVGLSWWCARLALRGRSLPVLRQSISSRAVARNIGGIFWLRIAQRTCRARAPDCRAGCTHDAPEAPRHAAGRQHAARDATREGWLAASAFAGQLGDRARRAGQGGPRLLATASARGRGLSRGGGGGGSHRDCARKGGWCAANANRSAGRRFSVADTTRGPCSAGRSPLVHAEPARGTGSCPDLVGARASGSCAPARMRRVHCSWLRIACVGFPDGAARDPSQAWHGREAHAGRQPRSTSAAIRALVCAAALQANEHRACDLGSCAVRVSIVPLPCSWRHQAGGGGVE